VLRIRPGKVATGIALVVKKVRVCGAATGYCVIQSVEDRVGVLCQPRQCLPDDRNSRFHAGFLHDLMHRYPDQERRSSEFEIKKLPKPMEPLVLLLRPGLDRLQPGLPGLKAVQLATYWLLRSIASLPIGMVWVLKFLHFAVTAL
jgi:hypothetical protein